MHLRAGCKRTNAYQAGVLHLGGRLVTERFHRYTHPIISLQWRANQANMVCLAAILGMILISYKMGFLHLNDGQRFFLPFIKRANWLNLASRDCHMGRCKGIKNK